MKIQNVTTIEELLEALNAEGTTQISLAGDIDLAGKKACSAGNITIDAGQFSLIASEGSSISGLNIVSTAEVAIIVTGDNVSITGNNIQTSGIAVKSDSGVSDLVVTGNTISSTGSTSVIDIANAAGKLIIDNNSISCTGIPIGVVVKNSTATISVSGNAIAYAIAKTGEAIAISSPMAAAITTLGNTFVNLESETPIALETKQEVAKEVFSLDNIELPDPIVEEIADPEPSIAKFAVSDSWATGYELGDKITIAGTDYTYGTTAFGEVNAAFKAAGAASIEAGDQVILTVVDAATGTGFTNFGADGFNVKLSGYSTTGEDVRLTTEYFGQGDLNEYKGYAGSLVIDSSLDLFESKKNFAISSDVQVYTTIKGGEVLAMDGVTKDNPASLTVYEGGSFGRGTYANLSAWTDAVATLTAVGNGSVFGDEQLYVNCFAWGNAAGTWTFVAKDFGVATINAGDVQDLVLGKDGTYSIILDNGKMDLTGSKFIFDTKTITTLTGSSILTVKDLELTEDAIINTVYTSTIAYTGSLTGDGEIVIDFTGMNAENGSAIYSILDGTGTESEFGKITYSINGAAVTADELEEATGYSIVDNGKNVCAYQESILAKIAVSDNWVTGYSLGDKITVNGSDYFYGVNAFSDMNAACLAAGAASIDLGTQVTLTVVDSASGTGFTNFGVNGYNVKMDGYSTTGGDVTVNVNYFGQYDQVGYDCCIGTLIIDSTIDLVKAKTNFAIGSDIHVYTTIRSGEVWALDGVTKDNPACVTVYEGGHFSKGGYTNLTAWPDAVVTLTAIGNGSSFGAEQLYTDCFSWGENPTGTWNIVAKDYGVGTINNYFTNKSMIFGASGSYSFILDNGKLDLTGGKFVFDTKTTTTLTGNSILNVKNLELMEGTAISTVYSSTISYKGSLSGAGEIVVDFAGLDAESGIESYTIIDGSAATGTKLDKITFSINGVAKTAAEVKSATGYSIVDDGKSIFAIQNAALAKTAVSELLGIGDFYGLLDSTGVFGLADDAVESLIDFALNEKMAVLDTATQIAGADTEATADDVWAKAAVVDDKTVLAWGGAASDLDAALAAYGSTAFGSAIVKAGDATDFETKSNEQFNAWKNGNIA